uniref:Uncharacterized protein n=1 Tax=Rhizophora mucronata TaxID=61149 RepID=A0A2P2NS19_RHIMU
MPSNFMAPHQLWEWVTSARGCFLCIHQISETNGFPTKENTVLRLLYVDCILQLKLRHGHKSYMPKTWNGIIQKVEDV